MRVDFISGPINGAYQFFSEQENVAENLRNVASHLSTGDRKFWSASRSIWCGDPTLTVEALENLPRYELVNNLFIWVEPANVKHS